MSPDFFAVVMTMTVIELFQSEYRRIKTQWSCKHYFVRTKTIHGDMINQLGYRSVWHCTKCDKRRVSNALEQT